MIELKCFKKDFPIIENFLFIQEFSNCKNFELQLKIIDTQEIFNYTIKEEFGKQRIVTC